MPRQHEVCCDEGGRSCLCFARREAGRAAKTKKQASEGERERWKERFGATGVSLDSSTARLLMQQP